MKSNAFYLGKNQLNYAPPTCKPSVIVQRAEQVLKEVVMAKVKMKTRRGAAKRFKATANGFKRKQAFKRHILTKKSPKRIRQLRGCVMVHVSDVASVRRMCPYI